MSEQTDRTRTVRIGRVPILAFQHRTMPIRALDAVASRAASDAIDLAAWNRRSMLQRLQELAARVGGPLF